MHLPRRVAEAILEGDDLLRHLDMDLWILCPRCRQRVSCTGGVSGAGTQIAQLGLVCGCGTQEYTGPLSARIRL